MKRFMIITAIIIMMAGVKVFAQEVDFSQGFDTENTVYMTKINFGMPITLFHTFGIKPYGSWDTWSEYRTGELTRGVVRGHPFRDIYTAGILFTWKDVYIDVQHFCTHNVASQYDTTDGAAVIKPIPRRWIPYNTYGSQLSTIKFGYKKTFSTINFFD